MPELEEEVVEPVEGEVVTPEPVTFAFEGDNADVFRDLSPEQLTEAVQLQKALQTEDGVIDAFIRTGQSLGFGIKELEKLFAEETAAAPVAPTAPAAAAAAAEELDPDRLLTAAEVDEIIAKRVVAPFEQREQERQQREFADRQKNLFTAVDSWFDTKEIKDPEVRTIIAQMADQTLLPGQDSYDPRVAIAALERAEVQYEALVEKQAQVYLAKKGLVASKQPTPLGSGQTAGGEGDETPDYAALGRNAMETARARVRARLKAAV